ncbi:hypothetical protein HGP28_10545 [Vibrio sp. SM6]|uniref:Outer membrane protein beta-barrel domain-containing protein n=1 Tax=Vibrio agarilyticus TaxID=2726741 RepID=A0A7X8YH87_9VIBR|nr:hypothetical protein [Vibrio agarilyticus]NLS13330.1 hypothetical protein [Vibrio agarilyticus]
MFFVRPTLLLALLATCTLLPLSASANNFNYNSLEFRMGMSPGTFGAEFTTFFTQNSHFIFRADSEFEGDWDFAGGVGFNGPLGQFADIYGQLLVHNVKTESGDFIGDEWLTEVNVGTRVWLTDLVELNAHIGQLVDNDNNNTVFGVGGRFHSTPQLSVGADVQNNGVYGHQFVASVRFQF